MKTFKIIMRCNTCTINNSIINNWILLDSRHQNKSAKRIKTNM